MNTKWTLGGPTGNDIHDRLIKRAKLRTKGERERFHLAIMLANANMLATRIDEAKRPTLSQRIYRSPSGYFCVAPAAAAWDGKNILCIELEWPPANPPK